MIYVWEAVGVASYNRVYNLLRNRVSLFCIETAVYMPTASGCWQKRLCFLNMFSLSRVPHARQAFVSPVLLNTLIVAFGEFGFIGVWWDFLTSCVLCNLPATLGDAVASCDSSMPPNLTEIDVTGSQLPAFLLSFLKFLAPQYCGFVHEIIEQLVSGSSSVTHKSQDFQRTLSDTSAKELGNTVSSYRKIYDLDNIFKN